MAFTRAMLRLRSAGSRPMKRCSMQHRLPATVLELSTGLSALCKGASQDPNDAHKPKQRFGRVTDVTVGFNKLMAALRASVRTPIGSRPEKPERKELVMLGYFGACPCSKMKHVDRICIRPFAGFTGRAEQLLFLSSQVNLVVRRAARKRTTFHSVEQCSNLRRGRKNNVPILDVGVRSNPGADDMPLPWTPSGVFSVRPRRGHMVEGHRERRVWCAAGRLPSLHRRGRATDATHVRADDLRGPLVPNLLNYFEFSNGYGEADSWFESRSLRHRTK
jgi:hypothetical protein